MGAGGDWKWLLTDKGFVGDRMFWNWIMVTVVPTCDYTKSHWIASLKKKATPKSPIQWKGRVRVDEKASIIYAVWVVTLNTITNAQRSKGRKKIHHENNEVRAMMWTWDKTDSKTRSITRVEDTWKQYKGSMPESQKLERCICLIIASK